MAPSPLPPLVFQPIPVARPWGGSNLSAIYRKSWSADRVIGESWEISDRSDGVNVIAAGPMAGRDLHGMMKRHPQAMLGNMHAHVDPAGGVHRFPWLVKILDCVEPLSLQVHPPVDQAREFGAEPKTECWFVSQAAAGAFVWAGLRQGVRAEDLSKDAGSAAFGRHLHQIPVSKGDAVFLPSGRVHAPGAGLVIFEVQENSDSTYRLYDWGRMGSDGKPRELHIEKGLACISMNDTEPKVVGTEWTRVRSFRERSLAVHSSFQLKQFLQENSGGIELRRPGVTQVIGVVEGTVRVALTGWDFQLSAGEFTLFPACCLPLETATSAGTEILLVEPGPQIEPLVA